MTAPQERPVAWRPKFGERVEGIYASPSNPERVGMFVRSGTTPRGMMNAGPWWELTDGIGHFWRYRPESCRPAEPQERPDGLDLDAVRRRAEAATAGPWWWPEFVDNPVAYQGGVFSGHSDYPWDTLDRWVLQARWDAGADDGGVVVRPVDAEFIAHARTDVPALVAEVERLRAESASANVLIGLLRLALHRYGAREASPEFTPYLTYRESRVLRTEGGAS